MKKPITKEMKVITEADITEAMQITERQQAGCLFVPVDKLAPLLQRMQSGEADMAEVVIELEQAIVEAVML